MRLSRIIAGLAIVLFPLYALAQTAQLAPIALFRGVDNNGNACSGCKLFTYQAGTTTKLNTFTDNTGGTPNANPVILNSRGEAQVWLTPGSAYKFVLSPSTDSDPPSNSFWTEDQVEVQTFGTLAPSLTAGQSFVENQGGTAVVSAGPLITYKNRVINGAQLIDQVNEGASVNLTSGAPSFLTDEFIVGGTFASTGNTAQRVTAPSGFIGQTKALKYTVGTGSATLNASDNINVQQKIEGQNVGDLGFGASGAQPVSISFWAQESINATNGVTIQNSAQNRAFASTFTLTANVAKQVCIANIPGDVTGTWLNTNGVGLNLLVMLSAGSTFQGTTGAWQGSDIRTSASQTNIGATTGATFQISGVQVEIGTNCTAFDARPFPVELALAQRYFEKTYDIGTAVASVTNVGIINPSISAGLNSSSPTINWNWIFKVTKRAIPTMIGYSSVTGSSGKFRDFSNAADVTATFVNTGMNATVMQAAPSGAATSFNLGGHATADARL